MSFRTRIASIGRLLRLQWAVSKSAFLLSMLATVLAGIAPPVEAYVLKKVIDVCLAQAGAGLVWTDAVLAVLPWLLLMAGSALAMSVVNLLSFKMNELSGRLVTERLNMQMCDKMQRIRLSLFDEPKYMDMYERASSQINGGVTSVLSNLLGMMRELITMIAFAVVILLFRWWLLLLVLALSVPILIISLKREERFFAIVFGRTPVSRQMNYYGDVLKSPSDQRELRIYGSYGLFRGKHLRAFNQFMTSVRYALRYDTWGGILKELLSKLGAVAAYVILCLDALAKRLTVGNLTLLINAVGTVQGMMEGIYGNWAGIYENILFFDLYDQFMNDTPEVDEHAGLPVPPDVPKTLSFRHVSFRYPNMKELVLKDVSFDIPFGSSIAIVGPNGAGKTTIIRLMLRFYEPEEGQILLDGVDVRDIAYDAYYRMISTVFQDFGRYALSLAESVAMTDVQPEDRERVIAALERVGLGDLLAKANNNPDVILTRKFDDSGIQPSVGQWQKIALARAFYKDPDFVILDEPSSALDPASECELYRSIFEMKQHKTVVFVSHRLISTIFADQILFIRDGVLAEHGTHEELMQLHGGYAEMFSSIEQLYALRSEVRVLEDKTGDKQK